MSWPNIRCLTRLLLALALAGLTAGCFEPLYGNKSAVGGSGVGDRLSAVEVVPIDSPKGTRLSRVGGEVRNELIYQLTGGGAAPSSNYRLNIRLTSSSQQVIVDINTARPDIQNYGIDATYTLIEVATGKLIAAFCLTESGAGSKVNANPPAVRRSKPRGRRSQTFFASFKLHVVPQVPT